VNRSYCVVGGGISGLVAAYRLRVATGPDATITLLDPADRLGGILRTERIAGQPFDVGAEAFITRRPEMPALLAELGMTDRQLSTTGVRPLILADGRLHPLPAGTLQGIPASAAALAGLVDEATLARIADEPDRPLDWRPGDDPSVGALVADRFGAQVVHRSVDPLLVGVYAGASTGIGLRSAVPTLAAALDAGAAGLTAAVRAALPPPRPGSPFGAVAGGYQVLLDELVARSGLHWVRTAARQVRRGERCWEVVDAEGGVRPADGVVLALPAPRLAELVAEVAPATAAAARRIAVASVAVVALALPEGVALPPNSGILVATGEPAGRPHSKAMTLSTRKWGARGGVELVRLSFGRFGDDLARTVTDEQLLDWSLHDLRTVLGVTAEPVDWRVQRWLDAMPQYAPGHAALVAELRAGLPAGLAVAGAYLDGIGVPACVGSATRAVASLLDGGVAR